MSLMQNLFSYLDVVLLLVIIFIWTSRKLAFRRHVLIIGICVLALASLIPINGLLAYMYPRALVGDLSMTTKAFMIAWLLNRVGGFTLTEKKEIGVVMRTMAIAGLVFYPLALGLTSYDPYSAGYSASILIVWVIAAAVYAVQKGYKILAAGISVGLLGYLFGVLESDNLFDYLFDPLLFLYALGYTCVTFLQNRKLGTVVGRAGA